MVRSMLRLSRQAEALWWRIFIIVQNKAVQAVLNEPPAKAATHEQQHDARDRARFGDGRRRAQTTRDDCVKVKGCELFQASGDHFLLLLSEGRYQSESDLYPLTSRVTLEESLLGVKAAGYWLSDTSRVRKWQSILVFRKRWCVGSVRSQ